MAFQFREVPNWQSAVTDLRVRQALMHAVDRDGLVEALNYGLGSPGHMFMAPSEPGFQEADRVIAKYPFDPSRASNLLADAGWRRAQPGGSVTGSTGQTLDIEVWTTAGGTGDAEAAILADNFKTVGINSSIFLIPSARQRDNELRTSFPALETTARSISPDNFVFTSALVPTPEARWQGPNRGSFRDTDVDRLHNVVLTSFDAGERHRATIDLHKRMTEIVGIGPLYYDVEVILAKSNVRGPIGNYGPQQGISWNIFAWEIAPA
jgi:peptide/nickel transport system substrate-binding protein